MKLSTTPFNHRGSPIVLVCCSHNVDVMQSALSFMYMLAGISLTLTALARCNHIIVSFATVLEVFYWACGLHMQHV
jgi:hypothetical protein